MYAEPRLVTSLDECDFYHTMEIPGHGLVRGQWDLRGHVDEYLGGVDLRGKRVLEIGTASGFLCFEMEKRGAEVVAYDLSENHEWDVVPYVPPRDNSLSARIKAHIRRLNDGWWLAHRAFRSSARVVYGTVYEIPEAIGPVDVATFGCVLLHLRDPFRALEKAARLVRETIVVTEPAWIEDALPQPVTHAPVAYFLPNADAGGPSDAWWYLSVQTVIQMLKVLGFPSITYSYNEGVTLHEKPQRLFTIVARRS